MGSFKYIVFCWVSTLSRRSVLIFKGESETQTHQGDSCDVPNEPLLARSKQKHWADMTIAGVWRLLSVSDGVRSRNSRFFLSVLAANCCRGALNPVIAGCSLPNIAASLHHFHNPEMPLHTHTCYTYTIPEFLPFIRSFVKATVLQFSCQSRQLTEHYLLYLWQTVKKINAK